MNKANFALGAVLFAFILSDFFLSVALAENDTGQIVRIKVTKKDTGEPIDPDEIIKVDISKKLSDGNARVKLPFLKISDGVYDFWEDECKPTIKYEVNFVDSELRRVPGEVINCGQKLIIVADVVYWSAASYLRADGQLSNAKSWNNVFAGAGGSIPTDEATLELSTKLATAVSDSDYGTIAIAGAEFASQLRKNGMPVEAESFAKLSLDATVQGIVAAQPELAKMVSGSNKIPPFTSISKNNVAQLTPEAREIIKLYQSLEFEWNENRSGFGVANWKTMRSLVDSENLNAKDFVLPDGIYEGIAIAAARSRLVFDPINR